MFADEPGGSLSSESVAAALWAALASHSEAATIFSDGF